MTLFKKLFFLVCALSLVGILSCKSEGDDESNSWESDGNPSMYAVAFSTTHGTAPNPFSVASGTVLNSSQLPNLSVDGYVFEGWYDENTKAVAGSYRVYKNVTLVAKWRESSTPAVDPTPPPVNPGDTEQEDEEKEFTVSFASGGYSSIKVKSGTVLTTEQLPVREDHEDIVFDGWYDGDTKVIAGVYTVTKDVRLYDRWLSKVLLAYSSNYGVQPEPIKVAPNTILSVEQLPELTCDGYIFEGWYDKWISVDSKETDALKVVAGEFTVTERVTIYAKWSRNTSITVKLAEQQSDITLNSKEENGTLILTADEDFTNYSWRIDDKVQSETSNTLILDTSTWTKGYYEVSVEAEKDGEFYSARAYITVGGN